MIKYVGLSVQIHGLDAESAESVRQLVEEALVDVFDPRFGSDIKVEIDEFAGTEDTDG